MDALANRTDMAARSACEARRGEQVSFMVVALFECACACKLDRRRPPMQQQQTKFI